MLEEPVHLVTIWSSEEEIAARRKLESEGIAVHFTIFRFNPTMVWDSSNQLNGLELLVAREDFEKAEAILIAMDEEYDRSDTAIREETPTPDSSGEVSALTSQENLFEPESTSEIINQRQRHASIAYRTAVLGTGFYPFHVCAWVLLYRIYSSDEPLGSKGRAQALVALLFSGPHLIYLLLLFRMIISEEFGPY